MVGKIVPLMTETAHEIEEPARERICEPEARLCLMCREAFESAWAGERICPRCKSQTRWRTGGGGLLR